MALCPTSLHGEEAGPTQVTLTEAKHTGLALHHLHHWNWQCRNTMPTAPLGHVWGSDLPWHHASQTWQQEKAPSAALNPAEGLVQYPSSSGRDGCCRQLPRSILWTGWL